MRYTILDVRRPVIAEIDKMRDIGRPSIWVISGRVHTIFSRKRATADVDVVNRVAQRLYCTKPSAYVFS